MRPAATTRPYWASQKDFCVKGGLGIFGMLW